MALTESKRKRIDKHSQTRKSNKIVAWESGATIEQVNERKKEIKKAYNRKRYHRKKTKASNGKKLKAGQRRTMEAAREKELANRPRNRTAKEHAAIVAAVFGGGV